MSNAERAAMIGSVLFTVALFGFVAWHAVTGTGAPAAPEASIATTGEDVYRVRVTNSADVGLESVTVVVDCGDPPRQVVFEHVPASGTRRGTVDCPGDAATPSVDVITWVRP